MEACENTAYCPSHVANFFLDKADDESVDLSQMKLQKLVYIAYGWVLAVLDRELFDDPIEAWLHGPVIPSLYHEFKHCGKKGIKDRSVQFDLDTFTLKTPRFPDSDKQVIVVLGKVWDVYKHFKASAIRDKTHEPGTPWSNVYKPSERKVILKKDDIKDHFLTKIHAYLDAAGV
jgi:uncharacterized phage-associated protein